MMSRESLERARHVRWGGHEKDTVGIFLVVYLGSARRRNVPFELTREEFAGLICLPCFYCGDPPAERMINSYKAFMVCNGIDRVDNTKGYTRDNCVTACKTCNVAKAALGQQEFINHCKKVASKHIGGT